jgi:hypothetical protein
MNFIIAVILLFFTVDARADSRVRRIAVKSDQIVTVRTALGIATIIQVPDRPNSVVVGDQDSFKVEYLDQAITIKPLHPGARSNLYVYTDYQRYNVQLTTGSEGVADYVVYLEHPKVKETKSSLAWMPFRNHLKNDALVLEVKRLGRTRDGALIIEFRISGTRRETVKPEWIWLTQNGVSKPIHNLIFSSLEVRPGADTEGFIQIMRKDIEPDDPLRIELRRKKTSYLTVPKVNAWK